MANIITKNLKNEKVKISQNFYLKDIAFGFFFLVIVLSIVVPLTIIGIWLQLVLGAILWIFLLTLLIRDKKSNLKYYQLLLAAFKHKSSHKEYSKDDVKFDVNLLMPYDKTIIDQDLDFGVIKTQKLSNGKELYMAAVEVQGFDLTNLEDFEQEMVIDDFNKVINFINGRFSLIKVNKNFNKTQTILFLNEKIKDIKNSNLTIEQKGVRVDQIRAAMKRIDITTNGETLQEKFYLFVYQNSIKELKEQINHIAALEGEGQLKITPLYTIELVNTLRSIIDPSQKELEIPDMLEINSEGEEVEITDMTKLLPITSVIFNPSSININEIAISINSVCDFPRFVNRCWLRMFMTTDTTIVINLQSISSQRAKKMINNAILNAKTSSSSAKAKSVVENIGAGKEIDIYHQLAENVGAGGEKLIETNIYTINYANTNKEVEQNAKRFNQILNGMGISTINLVYKQFEALSGMLPKTTDPLFKSNSIPIPGSTIADGFPFVSFQVEDQKGVPIGEDMMGMPMIFDQFKVDMRRINHNMIVMGKSGGGKSYFVKVMANLHLALGRKVILIDPEREYKKLCDYYKGTWIDAGSSSEGGINPLQIFSTTDGADIEDIVISEEHKRVLGIKSNFMKVNEKEKMILTNQINIFIGWMTILFPQIKDSEIALALTQNLGLLYDSWEWDKHKKDDHVNSIEKLKPTSYPIINDLINLIEDELQVEKVQSNVDLLNLLKSQFGEYGVYKAMYNGYSKLKIGDNLLIVFDINTLKAQGNENLIQSQMYLITMLISDVINSNGYMQDAKNEIVCIVDEAHLLIDKDNPIALNFLVQQVKQARKRKASITIITQNPADFMGNEEIRNKTKTIIDNVQYTVLFKLSSDDANIVVDMYKNVGNGISQQERKNIASSKKGHCLFFLTEKDRVELKVVANVEQRQAFGDEIKNKDK